MMRVVRFGLGAVATISLLALGESSHQLTTGETLTLAMFVVTCGAIVWRGGRLEGVLNRMERDVARLSVAHESFTLAQRTSDVSIASVLTRLSDSERRLDSVESTCMVMHRKLPS
jgi:hypothetical protein